MFLSTRQPMSDERPRWQRILCVFYFILLFPAILFSFTSAMVFDSPGSESVLVTNLFAFSLGIFPFTFLISAIGLKRKHPQSVMKLQIFAFAPVLNISLAIISVIFLQIFCGGSFSCSLQ